jgi:hypothetical protein
MLNAKKRSKSRNKVRCFCLECDGIYVDPRTKNKHSINQNIVKNTPNILQTDNNPMSESSQQSFVNEESSIEPKNLLTKNLLSNPKHLLTKNLQYFIQK